MSTQSVPDPSPEALRPQTWRGCALGAFMLPIVMVSLILLIALIMAPDYLVTPTLIVPDKLGSLRHLALTDLTTFTAPIRGDKFLNCPQAGTYIIFSPDAEAISQLDLRSMATGQLLTNDRPTTINAYGSQAIGLPAVAQVTVKAPDSILLTVQRGGKSQYQFAYTLDFYSRNQSVILTSFFTHLAVVLAIGGGVYYGVNRKRFKREKTELENRRARTDSWVKPAKG